MRPITDCEKEVIEEWISKQDHTICFYATNIGTNHHPNFLLQYISLSKDGHKLSKEPKELNSFREL
ncbi:30579_t:CDS:1, partial [Racocetra persica]